MLKRIVLILTLSMICFPVNSMDRIKKTLRSNKVLITSALVVGAVAYFYKKFWQEKPQVSPLETRALDILNHPFGQPGSGEVKMRLSKFHSHYQARLNDISAALSYGVTPEGARQMSTIIAAKIEKLRRNPVRPEGLEPFYIHAQSLCHLYGVAERPSPYCKWSDQEYKKALAIVRKNKNNGCIGNRETIRSVFHQNTPLIPDLAAIVLDYTDFSAKEIPQNWPSYIVNIESREDQRNNYERSHINLTSMAAESLPSILQDLQAPPGVHSLADLQLLQMSADYTTRSDTEETIRVADI